MNTAEPIRNKEDLAHIKDYYKTIRPNTRNYLLIIIGLNTALRVSDIIQLKWQDVFDFYTGSVKNHITLMPLPPQNLRLLCMETGGTASNTDEYLQPFFVPDYREAKTPQNQTNSIL